MWKFIHKIQTKPERERKRILIATTFSFTLIILIFWLISFQHSLKVSSSAEESSNINLIETIKSSFSDVYEGMSEEFASSTATSTATSTSPSTPGGANSTSTEAQ